MFNDHICVIFDESFKRRENKLLLKIVNINPITFHQSQETLGKYTQVNILPKNPIKSPTQTPVPVVFFENSPRRNTPNTGPLIKDPILFIATNTLGEILST